MGDHRESRYNDQYTMIHKLIKKLEGWFNAKDTRVRTWLLILFCIALLLAGWVGIRYISFDTKVYRNEAPVHIGSPSGELPQDSSTLKR
jgi:hypothetical protein